MDVFSLQASVILNSNAENQLRKIESQAQKTDEKIMKFGDGLTSLGEKMLTRVTLPIGGAIVAAGKLASDLNESLNKVDVAFKENSEQVKAWGNTTLKQFGIARGTALDMVSLYGDMATSMGFTTKKASEMGEQLVGRAADLSSFKNIGIKEAETALNGIFSGETESLKRLGVVMTQANLEQFALSQGIHKHIKEMTQAEQVQLRYNYVMEKTKNSSGDFARTSDGTANSVRQMTESFKQLGEVWGQNILPVVTPVIQKITDISIKLASVNEATQKSVLGFGAFAASLAPALILFGGMVTGIGKVDKGIKEGIGGVLKFGEKTAGTFSNVATSVSNFGSRLSPLGGIVGAKLAPVTGVFSGFGAKVSGTFSTMFSSITSIIPSGVGTAISGITTALSTLGSAAIGGLGSMMMMAMNLIAPAAIIGLLLVGLGFAQQQMGTQIDSVINDIIQKAPKLIDGFVQNLLSKIPTLMETGTTLLMKILEAIIATAPNLIIGAVALVTSLIDGVTTNLPRLIPMVLDLVKVILSALINNLPQILMAGIRLLVALAEGISKNSDKMVDTIVTLIIQIINVIVKNLPAIIEAGIKVLVALIQGISKAIPRLISALPEIFDAIWSGLKGMDWGSIGKNIISGIIEGVKSMGVGLANSVKNAASGALTATRKFLGINSPSRKFRDEIGQYIPQGIAVGISQHGDVINDQLKQLSDDMAFDTKVNTTLSATNDLALSSNTPIKARQAVSDVNSVKANNQQQQPIIVQNHLKLEVDGRELAYIVAENQDIFDRYNSRVGGAFA